MADMIKGTKGGGGGGKAIPFGGRWDLYTTLRWMTASNQYGIHTDIQNRSSNIGTDPILLWDSFGVGVNTGDVVSSIDLMGRTNNAEVTGVEFRMYLITGPLDGTWNSAATTTATLVGGITGAFGGNAYRRHEIVTNFTVPGAGFLVPYLKPEGGISTTRYLHLDALINFGGA